MASSISILAYDKHEVNFEALESELEKCDFPAELSLCKNSIEIINTLKETQVDLIILFNIESNLSLKGIRDILPANDSRPLIVVTEHYDREQAIQLLKDGAHNVFALDELEAMTLELSHLKASLQQAKLIQEQRANIRSAQDRFSTLINNLPVAIAYVQQGGLLNINNTFAHLFGLENIKDVIETSLLDLVSSDNRDTVKTTLNQLEKQEKAGADKLENIHFIKASQETFSADLNLNTSNLNGEACIQVIISPQAVKTESVSTVQELTQEQCLTPEYFIQQLNKVLRQPDSEESYALAFVEARDYARIKKNLGITRAEKVMYQVHELLLSFSDDSTLISQTSTDIFCILVKKQNKEQCLTALQQIQNAFKESQFSVEHYEINMPLNIGMVYLQNSISTPDQAFSLADVACTVARNRNDQQIHLYNPEQDRSTVEDLDQNWANSIRDAISNDNFRLVFQPIISLKTPGVAIYEVLLRMKNNDGKDILPNQFLHAARQNELELEIDKWVIKHTLKTLNLSQQQETLVFIKLGEASVRSLKFIQWLRALPAADKYKMVLEITEETAIKWPSETLNLLQERQNSGFKVCIEHFGNHPEAENELFDLCADFYKVDGAFSSHLATNRKHQSIIHKIALSSKGKSIKMIACFVQDADSLAILWQEGYDYIQGNYLQPPGHDFDYQFESLI
ncbi:MAG: EAL domain-containing protein [Gammaproteobacteria bacterium]|nr:EAL domain-containing protein [Gammaproteobacteria bacterium]